MTQSSMQRLMRIAVKALVTAHTPRVLGEALTAEGHNAIVEEHEPREGGTVRIRRRRPIEGRLHILERMASRETGAPACT